MFLNYYIGDTMHLTFQRVKTMHGQNEPFNPVLTIVQLHVSIVSFKVVITNVRIVSNFCITSNALIIDFMILIHIFL